MEEVKMHNELPFSQFIDPYSLKEPIDSRAFHGGNWRSETKLTDFNAGINKSVLPVDISKFKIMVITEVVPGRLIKRHKHDDEPMFRYIISGSMVINGEKYVAGEWLVLPIGWEYEIYTHEGYVTMAPYCMSCECNNAGH